MNSSCAMSSMSLQETSLLLQARARLQRALNPPSLSAALSGVAGVVGQLKPEWNPTDERRSIQIQLTVLSPNGQTPGDQHTLDGSLAEFGSMIDRAAVPWCGPATADLCMMVSTECPTCTI